MMPLQNSVAGLPATVSRRAVLKTAALAASATMVSSLDIGFGAGRALAATAPVANARSDYGVQLYPFALGAVQLTSSRFLDSQNRRLAYMRFLSMDRLLYNYRATAHLSTAGASPLGGWEDPNFSWRGHIIGHYLSGASHAVAGTGDSTLQSNVTYLVAELAKCQANAATAGYHTGFLAGFPESQFAAMESGQYIVVWYTMHKLMAGLLDAYRLVGLDQALTVLLKLAAWVDNHTGAFTYSQMQGFLNVEFGGMNEVLANLYQLTGDSRWLTVAQRFDHAAIYDPLAANSDQLNGHHANTQMAKLMGAIKEYEATNTSRYYDIVRNYWDIVINHHTYCTGGNSDGEYYHGPNQISNRLSNTTCEVCNVYNMLKISRELFFVNPSRADYMDYYEWALYNEILAQQDPTSAHGRVTYYLDMRPGAAKLYDDDYDAFWCDTGSSMESYSKLNDSIYFSDGSRTLYVNLFIPSVLTWGATGMTVRQATNYPAADNTTLTIGGSGSATIKLRIPKWTSNPTLTINGASAGVTLTPGTYATVSRTWTNGDTVVLTLPMSLTLTSTPDDPAVQSVSFGPVLLAGQYGPFNDAGNPTYAAASPTVLSALPVLDPTSFNGTATALTFKASANGTSVTLLPYYDTHNQYGTVYWMSRSKSGYVRLMNRNSNKVLGITNMGTTDGIRALQWSDTGTPDHQWELVPDGDYVRIRNANSGKLLGVKDMSTSDGAVVLQWSDNGTPDHDWTLVDAGGGYVYIVNRNSGMRLDVQGASTIDGGQVIQSAVSTATNQQWLIIPDGWVRIQNVNSGLMLGIQGASGNDGAPAIQWNDSGTADHGWTFIPDANATFRIRNENSGKVLGVVNESTKPGDQVLQWGDTGTPDHLWRLQATGNGDQFKIVNANSNLLLGVTNASTTPGALCLQSTDNGTPDHLWRIR